MIKSSMFQDTLKPKSIVRQDTTGQLSDSSGQNKPNSDSLISINPLVNRPVLRIETPDTTTSSSRNIIADINYYDSTNVIFRIDPGILQNFPYVFIDINRTFQEKARADIIGHLKKGDNLPAVTFHNDWLLPFILLSVFIYGLIRIEVFRFFKGILKFISLHGINEGASRERGVIFQWQSILFNFATFINFSMFAFLTIQWFDVFPVGSNWPVYGISSFAVVVLALTIRHFICLVIGNISGEEEIFREYLTEIYQAYRLAALLLLLINLLILYTVIVPVNTLFYIGFSIVALLYFIRVLRLFLIFINRHVSIFYLILYLCALEILPVVILVKYLTGLV
jgi:hypothetical protein